MNVNILLLVALEEAEKRAAAIQEEYARPMLKLPAEEHEELIWNC